MSFLPTPDELLPRMEKLHGSPDWEPEYSDAMETLMVLMECLNAWPFPDPPPVGWTRAMKNANALLAAEEGLADCSQCDSQRPKTDLHDGVCEDCHDSNIDCPVCGGCGGHPDLGCSGCGGSGMRRRGRGSRNDPDYEPDIDYGEVSDGPL